jgi:GlpG protein
MTSSFGLTAATERRRGLRKSGVADICALELPLEEDLRELSQFLWQHGLPHRIAEASGRQTVWVRSEQHATVVREVYTLWRAGEPLPRGSLRTVQHVPPPRLTVAGRAPLTVVLIALSIVGFFIGSYDANLRLLPWLTFFPCDEARGGLVFGPPGNQYWRLLTPIFLHFGVLHIVFNMLWLWDLGRRVEVAQGLVRLLGITLLIGVGSNIAQAVYGGVSVFGGMSGVIYGLLGYCWVWGRWRHHPILAVPTPVLVIMLVWLLICMVGFTEVIGIGAVANAAHLGGLLMGLLLGAAAVALGRAPERV